MMHFKTRAVRLYEERTGRSFAAIFDHYQSAQLRTADICTLILCDAYNEDKNIDLDAKIDSLDELEVDELYIAYKAVLAKSVERSDEIKKKAAIIG